MSIFGSLSGDDLADQIIDPKRLFRALQKPPNSPYRFPHDIQAEVWDEWYKRRDERDLVLKMNTGSGKTVTGLLILKSSLNEKKSPAIYLVPDSQLQSQAIDTATKLGIEHTSDPKDAMFRRGEAILIVPMHTMYNGLSQFGLLGSGKNPVSIGTIVVDDAHACISIIEEQFSLRIAANTNTYSRLRDLFDEALELQSYSAYSRLKNEDHDAVVPVPYWDWQGHIDSVSSILQEGTGRDVNKFIWPLIREQLTLCDVAFTSSEIEIRLPLPNLSILPSYTQAKRRIYMTATLADESVLATHMNVAAGSITSPITPASASDIGDRIILSPIEISREITRSDIQDALVDWSNSHNVVIIVPSAKRADDWKELAHSIHDRNSITDIVGELRSRHVGLVVLIARYDGVDLPAEACRILVLDGLPESYSPCERVRVDVTQNANDLDQRQIQRIEQGIGRGIRANDDYCAVVLLDPRLVQRLYPESARVHLSPATRAQYELSERFAKSGRGKDIAFFKEVVDAFLSRDPEWIKASKKVLEEVKYETLESVPIIATAQRTAFEHALAGRYSSAKSALDQAIEGINDAVSKGWIKQRAASYLYHVNRVNALALQRSARLDNSRILKLPAEVSISRISSVGNQSRSLEAHIKSLNKSPDELILYVESILADLTPSTELGSHDRFEESLFQAGKLLGFTSSRPDREFSIGPDNLWGIGDNKYVVLEAKSMSSALKVSRTDLEQLSHSSDWFEHHYANSDATYTPILIHPSSDPADDAVPRPGSKVFTFHKLSEFRSSFRGLFLEIADDYHTLTDSTIKSLLLHYRLNSGQFVQYWTTDFQRFK